MRDLNRAAVVANERHPHLRLETVGQKQLTRVLSGEWPSGVIVNDISILLSDRGPWASPPAKPLITRDGSVKKDDSALLIESTSSEIRNRWPDAVVAAMKAQHPEAFDEHALRKI